MDPSISPQPNYDFIMQAPQKSSRFGGGDKKQRIKVVAIFALVLITVIVILAAIFSSGGNKGSASLVDLAAYQTELTRVVTIGTTDAQNGSTRATAQIASMSLSTDLARTQALLKQRGIKSTPKDLLLYKSTKLDDQLAAAKKANSFDDTYKQLFDEKMASYEKKLSEVYASQNSANVQAILKDYNEHAKLLVFDYKTQ
jgi:hypothetical protein